MNRSRPLAWRASVLLGGLAFGLAGRPASGDFPLLITQVPRSEMAAPADAEPRGLVCADPFEHARIVVRSPAGDLRVLSTGFASACDPDVSFDGQRALFAGRRDGEARWRIWEIDLDAQGLRPVSPENLDARMPIHVSTLFTLDSPEPWFTFVFVSRAATVNEAGHAAGSSLYNLKLDGTELRRLTFSPNHNLDPFQMWDGRVIYAAETYSQEPGGGPARMGIHALHIEGADMELYGGVAGRRVQRMPCATEGGLVVFVESDDPGWLGTGQLACLVASRPAASYRRLSEPGQSVFLHPTPLRANTVFVARRPAAGEGTFAIVTFDADTGRCEPVFDDPEFHDVQAKPVRARARPDGHSTVVNPKFDTGVFYGLNAYTADPLRPVHLKPGEIKRVRFIEGLPGAAAPAGVSGTNWPFVARRLVGEAPVEADGSFNVEVPADTPLLLQTLDERGLALGTSGWVWVKQKETRGCIGCHEDPELVPENEYVLALRRPSNRLVLPPAQRRTVTFRDDIAPMLQRHCAAAGCHGEGDTPAGLPLAAPSSSEAELAATYARLMTPWSGEAGAGRPRPGRYVDAGRARTSWLVWQVTGTRTDRPWDASEPAPGAPSRPVKLMPPPGKGPPLDPQQLRTLAQWIDLGAQYDCPRESPAPAPANRASTP